MFLVVILIAHVILCVTCNESNGTKSQLNVTTASPTPSSNARVNVTVTPIPCVHPCSCYMNIYDNVTVRCMISQLTSQWRLPGRFQYLDLSYNGLTEVPTEFFKQQDLSNIRSLSLQGNNLTIIPDNVFVGLENLERLDLSFVNLREWKGNINRSLPSLQYLDVTGNSPWIPSTNVFAVKSLREIQGVTWSSYCYNCTLVNTLHEHSSMGGESANESVVFPAPTEIVAISNETMPSHATIDTSEIPPLVMLPKMPVENLANKFLNLNYFPTCHVPMRFLCGPSFVERPSTKHILTLPSQLFNIAYVLGTLAIVLNLAIILIYIYSTNIRKINSMLLISNMAFCDILIGVYAIIIAKVNIFNVLLQKNSSPSSEKVMVSKFCPVASVLFTVGQVVSVITALLLTIDKFLSIVYCMDPNRKLSRRLSLLVLILCWIGVLLFAFSPYFSSLRYMPNLMCTLPMTQMKTFVTSFCVLVALYLANIPLYAKIFVFVRRSSVRMGIRRDAVLAKKIAVLVFTNFVFFAVPMIVIIIFTFALGIHYTLDTTSQSHIAKVRFIVVYFMPIICLCFNSCLNPFLCAFRQRQFRREFKKCVRNCILSRMCKAFTAIRSDSSVRTTQPTRVEMYKLSNIDSQVQTL